MEGESAPKKKRRKRGRRYNGAGSVYKLAGNRKNPWVARITVGKDERGKDIYAFTYHETASDAELAIPTMKTELTRNPLAEDTVDQVWERFKAVRYPKLTDSTITGYNSSYSHWSKIHKCQIAGLKTSDLQKIINDKAEMSYSHLTKMRALMVAIFNMAAKDDIVKRNYASLVELPKGEPESDRRAFTDEELQKIRAATDKGIPYADVILFMCYTGWRPTEMCRLTAASVDTEMWFITGGVKTEAGKNRVVPVHLTARPVVSKWLNKGYKTLFTDEKGNALDKDKWGTRFTVAMRKIFGVCEVVPYTTRHTCASILHAAGADHLSIAKILGHKDYKITAQTYTHVALAELKTAVDTLP